MLKQQEGIVLEVTGRMAKVKASRHNSCENCGACPGDTAIIVNAYNPLGATLGQRVAVEVQEVNMLKAAFIVYIMPLLSAFIGAVIGAYGADYLGSGSLISSVIGGIMAFALSIWHVKYYDYRARTNVKMQPVITTIFTV